MSQLDNALNQIASTSVQDAKNEFQQLLSEAKGSSDAFVKDNAGKVESWIVMLSNNTIDKEEFDDLMADQKLEAEQFVNTQAIGAQAHGQHLTLQLLDLTATKIVPALLAVKPQR
jgi:hypothetical protein